MVQQRGEDGEGNEENIVRSGLCYMLILISILHSSGMYAGVTHQFLSSLRRWAGYRLYQRVGRHLLSPVIERKAREERVVKRVCVGRTSVGRGKTYHCTHIDERK